MTYLDGITGDTFRAEAYLASFDERVLMSSEGRRILTRLDPLLFALLYFPHHLRSDDPMTGEPNAGPITMADFHLDMCRRTRQWLVPGKHRDAEVAPRHSGKSTWNFLIRPMWALAHRHRKFVAAFADSGQQAQQHLIGFRNELAENTLLRKDHPGLCKRKERHGGVSVADRVDLYISRNDQIFMAKGIDASALGTKIDAQRPDMILFDDIEPDASNYTEYQKDKRAHSMIFSVMPMNRNAAVLISGTVTMPGSVVHDLVRSYVEPVVDPDRPPEWKTGLADRPDITEQGFRVNYYPGMFEDLESGETRSCWPQRWSVEWMRQIIDPLRHEKKCIAEGTTCKCKRYCDTAEFLLNFMNNPRGKTGGWWTSDDFRYGTLGDLATRWMIQIDPAVTTKSTSDYTAVSVLAYQPAMNGPDRVEIVYARQFKIGGEKLRRLILTLIDQYPQVKLVRIECNQGGELWQSPDGKDGVFRNFPVKVSIKWSTLPKEVRLGMGLAWYQRPGDRVLHTKEHTVLENTMIAYPDVANDDLPDCVVLGVLYFLGKPSVMRAGSLSVGSYA